ncbi:YceD family protein [Thioclava sp. GXIMD4215]|uniref:YceD family protein n=1 Tax=Thioclava sp. GXIMD4215 TaxID=3131928 RepID=UPI00325090DB
MTDGTPLEMPWSHPVAVKDLNGRKPLRFDISPEPALRKEIAQWADIVSVEALSFKGELTPAGKHDFVLNGKLHARITQSCVITLEPVAGEVKESVSRRFLRDWVEPTAEESEIPEDDSAEALPAVIDLAHVALEAFELGLPLYPRKNGAELGETVITKPGETPLRDEDLKPFANLKALMDKKDGNA